MDDKYVFEMPYDILIYAIGAETNDFKVPGVKQHAFYFKDFQNFKDLNVSQSKMEHMTTCTPETINGGPRM